MCGINGIVTFNPRKDILESIQMMNDKIIHRGPDDDGVYHHESTIVMGMRRLSIIDLSHGKQPITNETEDITITFNGEIYNYLDLQKQFIQEGVKFTTSSDTEVVLKMYEKYGVECLSYLNGMFAFAIHDKRKNILFIARDRFGEKPLYYYRTRDEFIWASELKSIVSIRPEVKKISTEALNIYLALTYIPAPFSIYQDVHKLKAGHYMIVDAKNLEISFACYWDASLNTSNQNLTYDEAKIEIRKLLFESVEKRMIADVPLGVFLSGGVDSTIVAAIMAKLSNQPVKTFSIGYQNKRYDESARARLVANHIKADHHEYILDYQEVLPQLDQIVLNYDEPFADSSALPTFYVSNKTVKAVTVALTGDGGDEVFGGYNKYLLHTYGATYKKWIPRFVREKWIKPFFNNSYFGGKDSRSLFTKIRKLVNSLSDNPIDNHLNILALGFKQNELNELLNTGIVKDYKHELKAQIHFPNEQDIDPIKLARYLDKQTSLEGDMLVKVDRASMLCSLECRAPFLDHRLYELTNTISDQFLIQGNNKKRILKDTFEDLLPTHFFNSPKSGFEIPVSHWLRDELKESLLDTLQHKHLKKHDFFNEKEVHRLIDLHMNGIDQASKLWALYCFQKWYNIHFTA